eukprot:1515370-Rhodomonas_salina.2
MAYAEADSSIRYAGTGHCIARAQHTVGQYRYWASAWSYAMRGTDIGYDATRRGRGSNGELRYLPTCPLRGVRYYQGIWCYTVCGTERAYGATRSTMYCGLPGELCSYAIILCYRPTRRVSHAMSGTDVSYAATLVLRSVRY